MHMLRAFWEDRKAKKRGEKRVAARHITGRVYARASDYPAPPPTGDSGHSAVARPKATLHRRVYRAATGTWETLPDVSADIEVIHG